MTPTSANGRLILTLVRIQLDALGSMTLRKTCHSVAFITRAMSHSALSTLRMPESVLKKVMKNTSVAPRKIFDE